MHPSLLNELAAARVEELRREAARERVALPLLRPSPVAQAARRSLHAFGYLLVGPACGWPWRASDKSRRPELG